MSIRELAERVLFSTSLEDKLRAPSTLVDDVGSALGAPPAVPGRPRELGFGRRGPKVPFPGGTRDLEGPEARGVALHFFANHELLAMELMALVLLRFPNAPRRFRMGVTHTLLEEQDHLQRYVDRMGELGVRPGDVPVSDFFWRCLADMSGPLDFVAGMSLTFEQANLDFARYYADRFREVGDTDTATLLDRVLADEIRHVAHGRVWLERWAPDAETLFERHRAALPGPLTLRRARGPVFCASERRAAGLPADYVEELRVHNDSRGRRPNLWVFNPGIEDALSGRPPNRAATMIEHDLAPLMGFLAAPDDIVSVPTAPTLAYRQQLADAGFELPRFVEAGATPPDLEEVKPWARPTDAAGAARFGHPRQPLPTTPRRLYAKSWSLEVAKAELTDLGSHRFETARQVVHELEPLRRRLADAPDQPLRLKDPFGASGRGHVVLSSVSDLERERDFIATLLRGDEGIIVEPNLAVALELSILVDPSQPRPVRQILRAWSGRGGRYLGHQLGSPWRRLPERLLRAFGGGAQLRSSLEALGARVSARLRDAGHRGPAGIDARVHRGPDGELIAVPIGEINPRYTMGWIAAGLARRARLSSHRDGLHLLVPRARLPEELPAPTLSPNGRGFAYTTDLARARRLVGIVTVCRPAEPLDAHLPAEARAYFRAQTSRDEADVEAFHERPDRTQ